MSEEQSTSNRNNLERSDNIENYEQYLLYNKAAIVQKLRQLERGKNLITAHFGGGKHSFLTAVVDVLPDKDILVLDYSSDEKMNKELMKADRAVFKTQHLGITAQFTCTSFQKAKRYGKTAIACTLPDSLLWVQRREFYRVKVPLSDTVTCEIHTEGENFSYPVLDISIGGIALHDAQEEGIEFESGQLYHGCKLVLGTHAEGVISLEVRNILPFTNKNNDNGRRIGCTFLDIGMDINTKIQRYIHLIETINQRVKHD